MVTQPDPAESSGLVLSCLCVRRGIGFLSLVLPTVLILGNRWWDGGGIRGSISDYYFTVMRDYFVGTMCAMGVLLVSYRYRRQDNYLSNAVAVFAIGVALFPTTARSTNPTAAQTLVGYVHLACATLFFLGMAYFSLFQFTRTEPGLIPTAQKRQRNAVCRVCGIAIVACLALVVVTNLVFTNHVRDQVHPVFWLESIAVWAFSVSWLVKGEFLFLRD
jgi:hypothetical protein